MSKPFSFSFVGDDIEETPSEPLVTTHLTAETGTLRRPSNPAFPIPGQALLPPLDHSLSTLLATLPSKIAYSTLHVTLDDGSLLSIPRREWWDVRVQLMAEEQEHEAAAEVGLGKDDIKTGVYEGGFKSWESSVDLVKVLAGRRVAEERPGRVLEMGCGTALPTLALLQWQLAQGVNPQQPHLSLSLSLSLADYNPSVLQLVTVPNILLSWAQLRLGPSWEPEGELDIDEELLRAFSVGMEQHGITLSFYSGAWSPEFVRLVTAVSGNREGAAESGPLLVLGAETIYSPMALEAFAESLMAILEAQGHRESVALVAAKKVYFGVGGSIEDFCNAVRIRRGKVEQIREEIDGVRRAVVEVGIEESGC